MPHLQGNQDVRPVDMEIGGDDAMPGIALELTTDDIDDIAFDPSLSLATRRAQLMGLLEELRTRKVGDYLGDMEQLSEHVENTLASLANTRNSPSDLGSTGIYLRSDDDDPADHMDEETSKDDGEP